MSQRSNQIILQGITDYFSVMRHREFGETTTLRPHDVRVVLGRWVDFQDDVRNKVEFVKALRNMAVPEQAPFEPIFPTRMSSSQVGLLSIHLNRLAARPASPLGLKEAVDLVEFIEINWDRNCGPYVF